MVVKAPYLMPRSFIDKFLSQKRDWISKKLSVIKKQKKPTERKYQNGEKFLYLGNVYKLDIGDYKGIKINDTSLCFPNFLKFRIKHELEKWFINEAKNKITERVHYYSQILKTDYSGLRFSDTMSKWGSCSRDNLLQFNWRLIMSPILVLDYVIVHELAHTIEKNHSNRFWSLVRNYKPAYPQYKKWLRDNSTKMRI